MYREANDEPCAVDRNRIEEKCNDRFIANFFFPVSTRGCWKTCDFSRVNNINELNEYISC